MSLKLLVRMLALAVFAVALGLLANRLRRSPEQIDLTQFVGVQIPSLLVNEREARSRLDRLAETPGPKPAEARALLVSEVIPHMLKLKHQAEDLVARTEESARLKREYLKAVDELIDACRACVRVIDDAKLPEGAGLTIVRERFAFVDQEFRAWDADVRATCVRHRLAQPEALHKR